MGQPRLGQQRATGGEVTQEAGIWQARPGPPGLIQLTRRRGRGNLYRQHHVDERLVGLVEHAAPSVANEGTVAARAGLPAGR